MSEALLLTLEEAARALGISRANLYANYLQTGRLPVCRLGGAGRAVRIPRTAIEQFVTEHVETWAGEPWSATT